MGSFAFMGTLFPSAIPTLMNLVAPLATAREDSVDISYIQLTGPVTDSYQEMEYFVPLERFVEAHKAFTRYVSEYGHLINFIHENRVIKGDDIWMSPFYKRDSASFSILIYKRPEAFEKLARGAEKDRKSVV